MAFTLVKSAAVQGSSGLKDFAVSFTGSLTTDNHIVVYGFNDPARTVTITDNKTSPSNTYTDHVDATVGARGVFVSSCKIANGAATVTVTATTVSNVTTTMIIMEWSGLDTSTWYDSSDTATGTGTAVATDAFTPTGTCLFIGGCCHEGTTVTISEGGTWTFIWEEQYATGCIPANFVYKSGSGSTSATWTLGSSQTWDAVCAAFREPSTAPVLPNQLTLLGVGQ